MDTNGYKRYWYKNRVDFYVELSKFSFENQVVRFARTPSALKQWRWKCILLCQYNIIASTRYGQASFRLRVPPVNFNSDSNGSHLEWREVLVLMMMLLLRMEILYMYDSNVNHPTIIGCTSNLLLTITTFLTLSYSAPSFRWVLLCISIIVWCFVMLVVLCAFLFSFHGLLHIAMKEKDTTRCHRPKWIRWFGYSKICLIMFLHDPHHGKKVCEMDEQQQRERCGGNKERALFCWVACVLRVPINPIPPYPLDALSNTIDTVLPPSVGTNQPTT